MQDQERGPRFGDDPQPGHWAEGIGGFAGMAYIAHGLDCLAGQAGMADGLSVLLKTAGVTIGQVCAAHPWQLREWYYRSYAGYSGNPLAGTWDVVAHGAGIHDFSSGWCLPARSLRRGCAAGKPTDGFVMPVPPRRCSVLR